MIETTSNCRYCKDSFIPAHNKRLYGKESSVYTLGFCSAQCYTKWVQGGAKTIKVTEPNP